MTCWNCKSNNVHDGLCINCGSHFDDRPFDFIIPMLDSTPREPTFFELIHFIIKWAKEREINNVDKQLHKLTEEVGELNAAMLRGDKTAIKDALGDVLVVLIVMHDQLGYQLKETLQAVYFEIKDRKGVTKNGSFIKDEDLG